MAKTLTGGMTTNIAKKFTNPVCLVAQDMGAAIIRSSSRELIDYGGNDYSPNGCEIGGISNDSFTWSLDNSDRAISIMALANDVGGNLVTLYLDYEGETITRFIGVIDEWFTQGQRVVFKATSQAAKKQTFPNERAENGTFNHLPAAGSNIMWGQQSIILQPETI